MKPLTAFFPLFLILELWRHHGRDLFLPDESEWNGGPLFPHIHVFSLSFLLCLLFLFFLIITLLCMSGTVNASMDPWQSPALASSWLAELLWVGLQVGGILERGTCFMSPEIKCSSADGQRKRAEYRADSMGKSCHLCFSVAWALDPVHQDLRVTSQQRWPKEFGFDPSSQSGKDPLMGLRERPGDLNWKLFQF